ncbi:MAG: DUF4968 domain-containing protein, partial [bacterium]|nr:DUF4968 domain-containing protein [bacterium]
MKKILIPVLLAGLFTAGCASRKTDVRPIPNGAELGLADLTIRVQFYADNTVRVTKRPAGTKAPERPSFCVVQEPVSGLDIRTEDKGGSFVLRSGAASVQISKSEGQIEFLGSDGRTLISEKGGP